MFRADLIVVECLRRSRVTLLIVLIHHAPAVPDALAGIVRYAFEPAAAAGGFAGATVLAALRYGVAHGIFSNEAGLGSASIAHAQARNTPGGQGLWAFGKSRSIHSSLEP